MARRKSTKKGGVRKTARRAYTGLKRRGRTVRAYARRRRGRVSIGRRYNRRALVGKGSRKALKECGFITAGGALGLLAQRYAQGNVLGLPSDYFGGAAAIAAGVAMDQHKLIYMGFGALYPYLYGRMGEMINPVPTST